MSRPIRFRAWDNENKVYLEPDEVFLISGKGLPARFQQKFGYVADKNLELEQYTGLKDNNGKEIYEGDIACIQGIKYYVDFEHGGFWFNNDKRRWKANRPLTHFVEINDCEIIGNIHENPELLGGEK